MKYHKKVISFEEWQSKEPSQPKQWAFYDYIEGNANPVDDWYWNELSDDGRDLFDAYLKNNAKVNSPLNWTGSKMLRRGEPKEQGIWEFRFLDNGKQQRFLGVFGQERKTAVLLVGCHHKDDIYKPVGSLETAVKRAKVVHSGRANTRKRTIKEDI